MAARQQVAWALAPGDTVLRVELHRRYGGRLQGGMTTSTTSPNIFLFTDPRVGEKHGYFDGWEGSHFHYTGMGQRGDQELRDANLALATHVERNLAVRLFRARRTQVTYLGEFVVDPEQPYYQMDAAQRGRPELRQVLVFKLSPRGRVVRDEVDDRRLPPGLSAAAMESVLEGGAPIISFIPVEEQHVSRAIVSPPSGPYEVHRREQTLVRDYKAYLEARGSTVGRLQVVPTGEANALRNDVFDETRKNVVEAKGTGTRAAVRMALGQVLDYSRFVPEARRGVLLPARPREDLERLLLDSGVHAVWPENGGFADNAGGQFT